MDEQNGAELPPETIRFDLEKSQHFRVIYADGAVGGASPQGDKIHIAFYNERVPLPNVMVHRISPDGKLGDEIRPERKQREAIFREVEVDVILDIDNAESVAVWLLKHVADARQRKSKNGGS